MQVVMSYCGIDEVLRETAGSFTLLEERISDTAIHNRLKACVPWVKAVLTAMTGIGAINRAALRHGACGNSYNRNCTRRSAASVSGT